jgi:1,4-alpha-glucan branching enzyme
MKRWRARQNDLRQNIQSIRRMNPQTIETRKPNDRAEVNRRQNSQTKNQPTDTAKSRGNEPAQSSQNRDAREVAFHFAAPSARNVLLAGEFTQWDKAPIRMLKVGGVWHARVLLPRGRHAYRFLVDGEWQNDPIHHERVANPFGTFNNVVEIS